MSFFQHCKAAGSIDGTASPPTVSMNYNVSSITDNGAGDLTVNFASNILSGAYAPLVYSKPSSSTGFTSVTTISASTLRILTYNSIVILEDSTPITFACFGKF